MPLRKIERMPIPNTSTLIQRIKKGSEGGNEFSRLMNLVLTSEYKECNVDFFVFSDAQGDYKGVDSFAKYTEAIYTGFQYKFYPSPLSANHKYSIKRSLENALEKFEELGTWIIITPDDFLKNDVKWFEDLKKKYEFDFSLNDMARYAEKHGDFPKRNRLKLEHWGHTKIIELMLRHPHVGEKYYPELFYSQEKSKFGLVKFGVDFQNCNWARYENHELAFSQYEIKKDIHKTSDILFDSYFINNSENIYLLHSIDVEIIEMWSDIKGVQSDKLLQSLGVIEIKVDFEDRLTKYQLKDPMIFDIKSPQRFKIQLSDFVENCPANCVRLFLRFNFSEHSIETGEIYLSF